MIISFSLLFSIKHFGSQNFLRGLHQAGLHRNDFNVELLIIFVKESLKEK